MDTHFLHSAFEGDIDTPAPVLQRAPRIVTVEDDSAKASNTQNDSGRPSPLKRLSSLKVMGHVPRGVFKSNRSNSTSHHPPAPRVPAVLLSPPSGHHRSHSDSLSNFEQRLLAFTIHSSNQGINNCGMSEPVSGQAREEESAVDSDELSSVSSHFAPSSTNIPEFDSTEDAFEEVTVPELMLRGTPLLKVSAKKAQTRVFRLDPDRGLISWDSKKTKYRMYISYLHTPLY